MNKKKAALVFIFLFNSLLNNTFCLATSKTLDIKEENIKKTRNSTNNNSTVENKFLKFIKNYIITEYNPIFKEKKHMIGLFIGYWQDYLSSYNYYEYYSADTIRTKYLDLSRKLFNINLSYSVPNHIFYLNGRLSVGLFSLLGNDKSGDYNKDCSYTVLSDRFLNEWLSDIEYLISAYKYFNKNVKRTQWNYKYRLFGVEIIQEIIFGHPNLYITFGAGISYIFLNNGNFAKPLPHNSLLNAVLTASIGHRFNNGMAIEAVWKHYSNGELSKVNRGINSFGMAIRYAFG